MSVCVCVCMCVCVCVCVCLITKGKRKNISGKTNKFKFYLILLPLAGVIFTSFLLNVYAYIYTNIAIKHIIIFLITLGESKIIHPNYQEIIPLEREIGVRDECIFKNFST